jgi:hypothetical protein
MNDRIERLADEASRLGVTKGAARDGRWQALGLAAMVVGAGVALLAYPMSLGKSDPRDIQSLIILAVAMLAVAVLGAAVFLRYSLGRFLRFWLLRQLYDGQDHIDQVVAALREQPSSSASSGPAPPAADLTERQISR